MISRVLRGWGSWVTRLTQGAFPWVARPLEQASTQAPIHLSGAGDSVRMRARGGQEALLTAGGASAVLSARGGATVRLSASGSES